MQEKERLLNLDEPLQFIFSHSALREGWDTRMCFKSAHRMKLKAS